MAKTRAAARAADLAAKATRVARNRRRISHDPDYAASLVLGHIERIEALSDTACGAAKAEALATAWDAYTSIQSVTDSCVLADTSHRTLVESVGSSSDLIAIADFDGYASSRIGADFMASDSLYEGWYDGHLDWN
jgi:hypothetical protein